MDESLFTLETSNGYIVEKVINLVTNVGVFVVKIKEG
jgi:hypothetical protein